MATINPVDVGLSGSTGTGNFVGSTSPTLVTPTIGVATATSVTFGSTALSGFATKAQEQSGSANTVYTSPLNQGYHPSAAQAWAIYNQQATPALTANYNISSLTSNSTGNSTMNLAITMSSTAYACVNSANRESAGIIYVSHVINRTTTSTQLEVCYVSNTSGNGTAVDNAGSFSTFAIFGVQA